MLETNKNINKRMQSDRTEGLEMTQILRELEHAEVHFRNTGGTTGSASGKVHFRLKYMLPKQTNMRIGKKNLKNLYHLGMGRSKTDVT